MTIVADAPTRAIDHLLPVMAFYGREAQLLDERRFDEWLKFLSPEIIYQVPVRSVTKDGLGEYDSGGLRINDRLAHIEARIKRLTTGWAWAEEPPSRVVRCVGSITVEATDEDGVLAAQSAVILHRHRAQAEAPDVMAYRRIDELVVRGESIMIRKRLIHMSENVLLSPNISIFL